MGKAQERSPTRSCRFCGGPLPKARSERERQNRVFCSQKCFGAQRSASSPRAGKTVEQLKTEKREYDTRYREKNRAWLKAKKHRYYQASRDPEKERARRQARREEHRAYVAIYNADPKNKSAKRTYDRKRRDSEYGEYAQCARLVIRLMNEIRKRQPSSYERRRERGYYEARQELIKWRRINRNSTQ